MLHRYKWILLQVFLLTISVESQIGRTYDTSEWIPVTPLANDEPELVDKEAKATGRVLNLAAYPSEEISSEVDAIDRKFPQQYYRETSHSKSEVRRRPDKYKVDSSPYKFENIPPPRPKIRQNQLPHSLELTSQFMQPPPLPQPQYLISSIPQATYQSPALDNIRYYPAQLSLNNQYDSIVNKKPEPSRELLTFNKSLYDSVNPTAINQGILNLPVRTETRPVTTPKSQIQKETIQLLYVPLENLKPNQPQGQPSQAILRQYSEPRRENQPLPASTPNQYIRSSNDRLELSSITNPRSSVNYQIPQYNSGGATKQKLQQNIENDFLRQALDAQKLQEQLQSGHSLLLETTTSKPKKRKPHQPPLAVYMESDHNVDVKDVLDVLKDAKTIKVQDSIGEDTPQVFVGPSNLNPPDGYTKFSLPYLSNVDSNRIGRKVDQLPFFVAPLSYKAPPGYSKIPLPSPHVGSVVVSTKKEEIERTSNIPSYSKQNYIDNFNTKLESLPDISSYQVPQGQSKIPLQYQSNSYLNQFTTTQPQFTTKNNLQFQTLLNSYLEPVTTESPEDKKFNDYVRQSMYQTTTPSSLKSEKQPEQYKIDEGSLDQLSVFTGTPKSVLRNQINQYINSQEQSPVSPDFTTPKPIQYTVIPQFKQVKQNIDFIPQSDLNQYNYFKNDDKRTTKIGPTTVGPYPNQQKGNSDKQSVLRQPISQYDLEQINNQFTTSAEKQQIENNYDYRSQIHDLPYHVELSSPKSIPERSTPKGSVHESNSKLESTTGFPRRVRTRHRTTTTENPVPSTKSSVESDRYTVLEEFSVKQGPSTTPSTFTSNIDSARKQNSEYSQNVEHIPANVYKIEPQQTHPIQTTGNIEQNTDYNSNIEHIPANVYKIDSDQRQSPYNDRTVNTQTRGSSQDNINQQILLGISKPVPYYGNYQSSIKQYPGETIPQTEQFNRFSLPPHQQEKFVENAPQNGQVNLFNYRQPQESTQLQFDSESVISQNQKNNDGNEYSSDNNQYSPSSNLPQINPVLPGLINNLQDQAVRPLLKPTLLVPTTEQEIHSTTKYDHGPSVDVTPRISISTKTTTSPTPSTITTERVIETTTTPYRRQRGRQRGGSRFSTAAPTRRSSRRRQPQNKTTTEYQKDYSSTTEQIPARLQKEESEATRRSLISRQRTRTRGRTTTDNSITERNTHGFKQPTLQSGFTASNGEPQSYMQFEHIIDNQEIVTIKASEEYTEPRPSSKEYHQIYSLTPQNRKESVDENKQVVDVQISHPITQKIRESDIISQPNTDGQYVRFNGNVQSGGVLFNKKYDDDSTTSRPLRIRGRGRGKIRTSTTTTTTSTTAAPKLETQEQSEEAEGEEEEFYGFIRAPNFNRPSIQDRLQQQSGSERSPYVAAYQTTQRPTQLYSNSNAIKNIQEYAVTDSYSRPQVQFVGEIRPKYQSGSQAISTASTANYDEPETEAPRTKTRGKIRIPNRKQVASRQDVAEHENRRYSEEPPSRATESSNRRNILRTRGKSHYRLPGNLKSKDTSEDEDVEGGNYPAAFFQSRDSTTRQPLFQITVDPNYADEESDEDTDQLPYSSINRPKVVTSPDGSWVEASVLSIANKIPIENKDATSHKNDSEEPLALAVQANSTLQNEGKTSDKIDEEDKDESITNEPATTTEPTVETTTKKKGRRRGVWKLVKHRPRDSFETAESQNYQSIINSFDSIDKMPSKTSTEKQYSSNENEKEIEATTTNLPPSPPTKDSFFDTLYDMFGISKESDKLLEKTETTTVKENDPTTTAIPIFPNEYLEETTSQNIDTIMNETTTILNANADSANFTTEVPSTSAKSESTVEETVAWDSRGIKTSTSTEVSHETEICYKGKCVKSSLGKKIKL